MEKFRIDAGNCDMWVAEMFSQSQTSRVISGEKRSSETSDCWETAHDLSLTLSCKKKSEEPSHVLFHHTRTRQWAHQFVEFHGDRSEPVVHERFERATGQNELTEANSLFHDSPKALACCLTLTRRITGCPVSLFDRRRCIPHAIAALLIVQPTPQSQGE